MSVNPKRLFMFAGAALAVAGVIVLRLLTANHAFANVQAQALASCASTPLTGAAADFEIDRTTGTAYLSVLDRRAAGDDPGVSGSVYHIDLKQPGAPAIDALVDSPKGLRPAGLGLWVHEEGPRRLFVVNQALDSSGNETQSIEIFEQQADGRFHHLKTITDPLLVHPNDVVAVGADQFYVTNDRGGRNVLSRAYEAVVRPGWSTVLYFDGAHFSLAVSDRVFAKGAVLSADGLRLFLSESGARQLLIFDRDPETGSLYWSSLIEVSGAPDKLGIGADGSLWAAVQPNEWKLARSLGSGGPAPTRILRFAAPVNGFSKPQTIYADDGRQFAGGSIALSNDGRVLLGSVTEKRLLSCLAPAGS